MPKITQKFASESPKVESPTLPESDLNKLAAKNNEKKTSGHCAKSIA